MSGSQIRCCLPNTHTKLKWQHRREVIAKFRGELYREKRPIEPRGRLSLIDKMLRGSS